MVNWIKIERMANQAEYICMFTSDSESVENYEHVKSGIALNCGDICTCTGLKNNSCFFGPDDKGHFVRNNQVSSEVVDSCDQ